MQLVSVRTIVMLAATVELKESFLGNMCIDYCSHQLQVLNIDMNWVEYL